MEKNFFSVLARKKSTFFLIVFLFLSISAIFIMSQRLNYSTKSRLIVMSAQGSTDPYATSRFNEYMGELLSRTIVSNKFYQEVVNSGYTIDKSYFTSDPSEQNEIWSRTVKVEPLYSVGIIDIEVFHPEALQSRQIAIAINNILATKNADYYSAGNNIKVEIINEPTTSNWIVRPNIPLSAALGLIFGVVFALSYIYLFPEEEYDLRLWGKSRQQPIADRTNATYTTYGAERRDVPSVQEAAPTQQPDERLSSVIVNGDEKKGGFRGEGDMNNVF